MAMTADLHVHTEFSDGTDSVERLFAQAQAAGLTTLGLTDHDTSKGWAPAAAAVPPGIRVLPGAEFSTKHPAADGALVSVHLLGYLFDADDPAIVAEWQRMTDERENRGTRIVEKLIAGGYDITVDRVQAIAGPSNIGRPHIAKALVEAGEIGSIAEAFTGLLDDDGEFYVPLVATTLEEGIALITGAGGVPVIAHPRARAAAQILTGDVLASLTATGLQGIEVRHPDHDDAARTELAGIAADLGLLQTGSSDYHGDNKTLLIGQERTADDVVDAIVDRGRVAPFVG